MISSLTTLISTEAEPSLKIYLLFSCLTSLTAPKNTFSIGFNPIIGLLTCCMVSSSNSSTVNSGCTLLFGAVIFVGVVSTFSIESFLKD